MVQMLEIEPSLKVLKAGNGRTSEHSPNQDKMKARKNPKDYPQTDNSKGEAPVSGEQHHLYCNGVQFGSENVNVQAEYFRERHPKCTGVVMQDGYRESDAKLGSSNRHLDSPLHTLDNGRNRVLSADNCMRDTNDYSSQAIQAASLEGNH